MDIRKIDFDGMPWTEVAGLRFKMVKLGGHRIRLVEYPETYEEDWCERQHTGFVVEGRITITYDDTEHTYEAGQGLHIRGGRKARHRARVAKGDRAVLVLFEPN